MNSDVKKQVPPLSVLLQFDSDIQLSFTEELRSTKTDLMAPAIVGVDEVGLGSLAGPIVAAAVYLPAEKQFLNLLHGLFDSKAVTFKNRLRLAQAIRENALYGIGSASVHEINSLNNLRASHLAMSRALSSLIPELEKRHPLVLVDGDKLIPNVTVLQKNIIGGDAKSASIAAASIVAKAFRDNLMIEYSKQFPGYQWEKNFGYGSKSHCDSITEHGLTPIHRASFKSLDKFVATRAKR